MTHSMRAQYQILSIYIYTLSLLCMLYDPYFDMAFAMEVQLTPLVVSSDIYPTPSAPVGFKCRSNRSVVAFFLFQ